jgi:Ca2+-binding RTX toxin-like protein
MRIFALIAAYLNVKSYMAVFTGTLGNDTLVGTFNDDTLRGLAGDDFLDAGFGFDLIDGGTGVDTVSYTFYSGAVVANLQTGVISFPGNSTLTDTLIGIENIKTGSNDDEIVGTSGNNRIETGSGNDTLRGGGGNDFLDAGFGFDLIVGGTGVDTVSYTFYSGAVVANLQTGIVSFPGNSTLTDTLIGIENIQTGNAGDRITGSSANNNINSGGGNDILKGGNGRDTLNGGNGNDTLTGAGTDNGRGTIDRFSGGIGSDRFILSNTSLTFYNDGNNANAGLSDYARIVDFNKTSDRIQLEGSATGYLLGSSPLAGVSGTAIYQDTNGNRLLGARDELIAIVQGSSNLSLTSNYFIYV